MSETKERSAFDPRAIYETWERAANAWFETWSRSPAFLAAMGETLEAQLGVKSGADRWVETWCEAWRVPTAKDVASLASQVADLEARVAELEARVGTTT